MLGLIFFLDCKKCEEVTIHLFLYILLIFIEDYVDRPIDKHRVIWYDPHDLKTSSIEYERWGFNMSYVSGSLTFLAILGTHFGHFEKSHYPIYFLMIDSLINKFQITP